MKITEFINFMSRAIAERVSVLVTGRPGLGKTQIPLQLCAQTGTNFVLKHPVTEEPIDYAGVPAIYRDEGIARQLPMGQLADMVVADKPMLVWLDDLGQQTSTLVQGALMQLIEARQINGKRLPDHVFFGGATNRQSDGAGVAGIITPLLNRFDCIVELEPDVRAWQRYIMGRKYQYSGLFAAFVDFKPDYICKWQPTTKLEASCTPRSLEKACRLISLNLVPEEQHQELLTGIIGSAAAVDLHSFLSFASRLPLWGDIERSPSTVPLPDRKTKEGTMACYILAGAMAHRLQPANVDAYLTFAERFAPDIRVLAFRTMLMANKQLVSASKVFVQHAVRNAALYADL